MATPSVPGRRSGGIAVFAGSGHGDVLVKITVTGPQPGSLGPVLSSSDSSPAHESQTDRLMFAALIVSATSEASTLFLGGLIRVASMSFENRSVCIRVEAQTRL